ncbi:citrate/2-methylcitrate synthase [uncultured Brevundimonas sp.]|uniref:citrate/2-methylcitrate synthase n=1 Tax=uncultured Brevundimonas sp. TaxID=213418 RepID=UPI0030EBC3CF
MQTIEDVTRRWIGRNEALDRLGVKTQTLYAYVSRGRIIARPDPLDSRRSLYDAEDIDRLSRGEGPALRPVAAPDRSCVRGEADIASSLSVVADGRLFYRGLDAVQLSQQATLEEIACRLWGLRDAHLFTGIKPRLDGVIGVSIRARTFAILSRRAEEDVTSRACDAETLKTQAACILNETIDAASGPGPRLHFHQRLARAWKTIDRDSHMIRRALVLAADDELDSAVLAVRAAVGGGAPLAGAALGGITTLVGSTVLRDLTDASAWVVEARRGPVEASRRRLQETGSLPGFTAAAGTHDAGRAAALLSAADLPADLLAVQRAGEDIGGGQPTFAMALAIIARRLELPRQGAADLFMLGRLTGLLGHALDQATNGSPIRARLRYVGPEPGAN